MRAFPSTTTGLISWLAVLHRLQEGPVDARFITAEELTGR